MTKHEEGVRNLDQIENLLTKLEKAEGDIVTRKTAIILTRAVWWLLDRYLREDRNETN